MWVLGCDVFSFAHIIIEFVEFVGVIGVKVDEFPVSFADGVGGFVGKPVVVGVGPVEGASFEDVVGFAVDGGCERLAVEVLGG